MNSFTVTPSRIQHDTDPKVVIDIRGTLIHMLSRGEDPDALLDNEDNKVNRAAWGFRNWLDAYLGPILENNAPRQIIAVWDGGNNYRRDMYPDYKAKRKDFSEVFGRELDALVSNVKSLLCNLGALQVYLDGQEADDVIAYLCENIAEQIDLYSNDRDLMQLADGQRVMFFYQGNATLEFEDEGYRYPHTLVRIYKSLVGDSSDNYPGVKGFGPVGFAALAEKFGYDGLQQLEDCVRTGNYSLLEQAIRETNDKHLKLIYSQRFADKEKGIVGWQTCYNLAALAPWLCEKRFRGQLPDMRWVKRLPNKQRVKELIVGRLRYDTFYHEHLERYLGEHRLVTDPNEVAQIINSGQLNAAPITGVDIESADENRFFADLDVDYVDVLSQKIAGVAVTYGNNLQHNIYLPVRHKDTRNLPIDVVVRLLREIRNPAVHNASFEIQVFRQDFEFELDTPVDTLPMASQVDQNEEVNLKHRSKLDLSYEQQTYKGLMAQVKEDRGIDPSEPDLNMFSLTGSDVLHYGCDDAFCTAHLWSFYDLRLQLAKVRDFTYNSYMPAAHPLNEAFAAGETIDFEQLAVLAAEDKAVVDANVARIRELLEENCKEPNQNAAKLLFVEDYDYHVAKWRQEREMTADDMNFRGSKLVEKYTEASVYHPFKSEPKEPEFKPTAKQLDKIRELVGIELPIEKDSKSYLANWLVSGKQVGAQQIMFCALLGPAIDGFKTRSGEAYEAFARFCCDVLRPTMPLVSSGDELNLGSPNQITELLYLKLALPIRKRGKVKFGDFRFKHGLTGSPSTDEKAILLAVAEDTKEGDWKREVLQKLVEAKKAITRNSYYYKPYPARKHPLTGKVHGSLRFPSTKTRRPTASEPNFLQVTKKDGGKVRNCFIPEDRKKICVAIDFSQQELRILASESRDPFLMNAYLSDPPLDVHAATAALVLYDHLRMNNPAMLVKLGIPAGEMAYDMFMDFYRYHGEDEDRVKAQKLFKAARNIAKVINFLLIYGGGAEGIAIQLGIPTDVARVYQRTVLGKYTGFTSWQAEQLEFGRQYGYAQLAFGSRYYVGNGLMDKDDARRARWERQFINSMIQGTAAEILAYALSEMHKRRVLKETGATRLIPIYDENRAFVPVESTYEYIVRTQEVMNILPPGHVVPMVAEVSVAPLGKGWGSMIELGANPTREAVEAAIKGERLQEVA